MDNKVLELLELNLKALKKVNPLLYGLFVYYTYFVILYLTGSFLVGKLSRSRCCIFGAIHLSFFVIVMVVARSADGGITFHRIKTLTIPLNTRITHSLHGEGSIH